MLLLHWKMNYYIQSVFILSFVVATVIPIDNMYISNTNGVPQVYWKLIMTILYVLTRISWFYTKRGKYVGESQFIRCQVTYYLDNIVIEKIRKFSKFDYPHFYKIKISYLQ